MGLIDKLKNVFFEEVDEDDEEEIPQTFAKKVEVPKRKVNFLKEDEENVKEKDLDKFLENDEEKAEEEKINDNTSEEETFIEVEEEQEVPKVVPMMFDDDDFLEFFRRYFFFVFFINQISVFPYN